MQNENEIPDEAVSESDEQVLARFYDTSYLLQRLGYAEINIVETEDGKNLVIVVLTGVKYDKEEGFIKE